MPPQMVRALPRVKRAQEQTIEQLRASRDRLRRLTHGAHPRPELVAEFERVEDLLIGALREQRRQRQEGATE